MSARREEDPMDKARPARAVGDERGMALVLALMVLLVLTVIGAALMANVTTETKIAGYKIRDTQSLAVAEAGVQEAMLRIRNGDFVDDLNPRNVTFIYDAAAGSIPVSGTDTTSLATLQPAGQYLGYSSANKNPMVLTIKYKTRGGTILRYDDTATPKINTATGNPIFVIESTGRTGNAYRKLYTEVTRSRVNVLARAAVAADVGISFKGNIKVCGHDHMMSTNSPTAPPACDGVAYHVSPNTSHTSCLPGAWSQNNIGQQGAPTVQGSPVNTQTYQTGFYSGPWDCLGMTQNDFWAWVGTPHATEPAAPLGIYYLDDDGVKQNQSGDYSYNGGDGEGLLYVDGDLGLNGSFTYKGLIYVEGDLTINGNCWILGGLIVKGKSTVKIANGSAIVLYSSEAISQKISRYGGNMRTIAWREL
jgi:Tfp pilus assembly protein PilX